MQTFSQKELWERPYTSKRYLQPPCSNLFCTQWTDFKVITSRFQLFPAERMNFSKEPAAGFRLLLGEEMASPEFTDVDVVPRLDGVPIHELIYGYDDMILEMESFCDIEEKEPAIYNRIFLTNNGYKKLKGVVGFMPRSGFENYLTGNGIDGYADYYSDPANWGFVQNTWKFNKGMLTDGEYDIIFPENEGFKLKWQGDKDGLRWAQRHILRLEYELSPGETACLTAIMSTKARKKAVAQYDKAYAAVEKFWFGELARIKRYPDAEYVDVVNNLVVQCLQMFARFDKEGFIAPRQGGLNRYVWSAEAVEFLTALDRLGDFDKYVNIALDYYFNHAMITEGEDAGQVVLKTGWASTTGAVCRTAGYHAKLRGKKEFTKWRDKMYLCFKWMEKMRALSYTMNCVGKGIFPSAKSTDWPEEAQAWCVSDGHNLTGYKELAESFELYKDPAAKEIRAAYEDYLACEKKILAGEVAKNKNKTELLITNRLGRKQTDPPFGPYFGDGPAMLIMADVLDPKSKEAKMCEQYFINRQVMRNGLTGLMSDGMLRAGGPRDPWAGHMWYLSSCDSRWFKCWMAQGEKQKAYDTMTANLKYGMTEAYYMQERYADNDPCWLPWQPNASANGRMLHMLCDYFGTKEVAVKKTAKK